MIPDYVKEQLLANPYVVGFSNTLKPKLVKGKPVGEMAVRIYVVKKLPREYVPEPFIIPEEIDGVKTDVVEIGFVKKHADRTIAYRPLEVGISIGNLAITAGTLGGYYRVGDEVYLISNAHVFCEDPMAKNQREKRISQPGPYDANHHNLNPEDYVVGELAKYTRIIPYTSGSDCPVSKMIVGTLNTVYRLLGRKTRFTTYVSHENTADAAIARIVDDIEIEKKFVEGEYDYSGVDVIGLLFAGSSYATLVSKARHIDEELGGMFWGVEAEKEAKLGDRVCKVGRTTGFSCGTVIDESADMKVWYGEEYALFHDVVVTTPMSKPGDSGSMVFLATSLRR